jgi:hypothetical protein
MNSIVELAVVIGPETTTVRPLTLKVEFCLLWVFSAQAEMDDLGCLLH